MKVLKLFLEKYFSVSETEIGGFFILILLVVLLGVSPMYYRMYLNSGKEYTFDEDRVALNKWIREIEDQKEKKARLKNATTSTIQSRDKAPILQKFDPNKASLETLKAVGIPAYLAKRIIKYRIKGGKFYEKGDLKKIYGFSDELFEVLSPYISINYPKIFDDSSNKQPEKQKPSSKLAEPAKSIIMINQADTTAFKSIRGIGVVLSARIVKFRDKLGGFYQIEQLSEVYGLKPDVYERLAARASCNGNVQKTIAINRASVKELARHPYLNWELAKKVEKARIEHGIFQNLPDITQHSGLNEELVNKIAPYITFE